MVCLFLNPNKFVFIFFFSFGLFSRIPCRGIYSFCGVCFHGGHIDHIKSWFNHHDECPYGCGHRCKDRDTQNRPLRGISQRFTSRSSFVSQQ